MIGNENVKNNSLKEAFFLKQSRLKEVKRMTKYFQSKNTNKLNQHDRSQWRWRCKKNKKAFQLSCDISFLDFICSVRYRECIVCMRSKYIFFSHHF